MMKTAQKVSKLSLKRESIRRLTSVELAGVVGGNELLADRSKQDSIDVALAAKTMPDSIAGVEIARAKQDSIAAVESL